MHDRHLPVSFIWHITCIIKIRNSKTTENAISVTAKIKFELSRRFVYDAK